MLVRVNSWLRTAQRRTAEDDGASIVAVLGVMLIGFMAVALVASATMFAVTSTKTSGDRTQALISAESGRDAAYAALASGEACRTEYPADSDDTATIHYKATIYVSSGQTAPKDATGLSVGCPNADTKFVVIHSEGTAAGAKASIDAVYPVQREIRRMGTGIGASGDFNVNIGTYRGDVIVRDGKFGCLALGTVVGDVYVLNGGANFGLLACRINGRLEVSGKVNGLNLLGGVTGDIAEGRDAFKDPSRAEIEKSISWFDLNEATTWPGFARHEYPATTCATVSDDIRTRLGAAGEDPIVLDATRCGDLSFSWTNLTVKRNAVILVKNGLTMNFSTISASDNNRELYIVQTNTSENAQHPAPKCGARKGLKVSNFSGLFQKDAKTFIYTPCSVNGFKILSTTKRQVIAPYVDNNLLLAGDTCVPFKIDGLFDLSCSISGATGGGASSAGTLGRLLSQSER